MMNIREKREAVGMTQAELAFAIGITPAALCLYETGKRTPKITMAVKIAKALGCTVDDLVREQ